LCSRIFAALVAGIATGILGVTGFKGFLLFVAFQLAVSTISYSNYESLNSFSLKRSSSSLSLQNAAALFIKCGFAPDRYYQSWYV
jgi:hypothetical protein